MSYAIKNAHAVAAERLKTASATRSSEGIKMSDEIETIESNPKSWGAWKREAERLQKIIDDAANREAQPVAIVESSDYVKAAQITGDEPRGKAVKELYEGALIIGQHLYTAQPAPSVTEGFKLMPIEMTDEIAEAIAMEARCCGGIALCIYEAALAAAPDIN